MTIQRAFNIETNLLGDLKRNGLFQLKIKCIFIIAIFLLCLNNSDAQVEFFIAPTGSDTDNGSVEKPLASLIGARNAIRQYKNNNNESVTFTIRIAHGYYIMNEPLILTQEDSGSAEYPIIYKAEDGASPVFSGGKEINGFKVEENGVWEVELPENFESKFDQLYIDNKKAVLARTPNKGFLKIGNVKENVLEKGKGRVAVKAEQTLTFDLENFAALQTLDEDDVELLRFRAYHKWDFTIRYVDKLSKGNRSLLTSGTGMKPWNPLKKDGRIIFENYKAAMDQPGEWFLSKNRMLSYIPLPGQTPENTKVVAPVLDKLVEVKGNIKGRQIVEHITFDGIAFQHSQYLLAKGGFEPNQAATAISSSILLEGAQHITFSNCTISQIGHHAIWFGKGCSYSQVKHCYIKNIGGGGIYLGDKSSLGGEEHTHDIMIENNIIHSGGKDFPPAVGIWVGHSSDITIKNNDIADFYYSGLSVGWTWGYKPSLAKRNKITFNNIHHIGWDLLSDMAAVYTLGKSEGTVISNNVIHHVHAFSYGGWGLYTDEGSSDIIMENNLVYSTKTGGFHQHYGQNNIIRNNILAYAKLYQAQCTRVEEHRSFDFNNNIIIFDKGVVLRGAWKKIDIEMDENLYWNTGGDSYDFNGQSFQEWQLVGHDAHSFIGNPNFVDAPNFNFQFKSTENIEKINFKTFDFSQAGVYGTDEWKNKSKLSEEILENFDKVVNENLKM